MNILEDAIGSHTATTIPYVPNRLAPALNSDGSVNDGDRMNSEICPIFRAVVIVCGVLAATPKLAIADDCHASEGSSRAAGPGNLRFICPAHGIRVVRCGMSQEDEILLSVRPGTRVHAAADGLVSFAGVFGDYGPTIVIRRADGFSSLYSHLGNLTVERGDWVKADRIIATANGSPGEEFLFQLRYNGKAVAQRRYVRCY